MKSFEFHIVDIQCYRKSLVRIVLKTVNINLNLNKYADKRTNYNQPNKRGFI
jgi:hypothetical protein